MRLLIVLLCFFHFSSFANPLVIAHRGASGYLPEHTKEALVMAYMQNADYIEQDLVLTKDNVPIVLHDIHLETGTNVEQVFPDRAREDGRFYAIDFTLAEIKQLDVHERTGQDGKQVFANRYSGSASFKVATFEEQLEMIKQLNRQFGRNVGWYPEIKSPAWHRSEGKDISAIVLEIIHSHGLDDKNANIYVQCFDFAETKRIRHELGAKVKLVQLLAENDWGESKSDYDYLKTEAGLKAIAQVADGIGPWMMQLVTFSENGIHPTTLVPQAKAAGLSIHPYTFRKDQLPPGVTVNQTLDLLFKQLQVDGVFTDFTDTVVDYLNQ